MLGIQASIRRELLTEKRADLAISPEARNTRYQLVIVTASRSDSNFLQRLLVSCSHRHPDCDDGWRLNTPP
jgi:hypothetical protein